MRRLTGILFPLRRVSCGFETDGKQQFIEIVHDTLVEAVQLGLLGFQLRVTAEGAQQTGSKRGIDALEQLQEDEADRISLRQEAVAPGVGKLLEEALGPEFGEIVAQRSQRVLNRVAAQSFDCRAQQFSSAEGVASGDVRETDERVH